MRVFGTWNTSIAKMTRNTDKKCKNDDSTEFSAVADKTTVVCDNQPTLEMVKIKAPDGGYGWVIVVATFVIYVSTSTVQVRTVLPQKLNNSVRLSTVTQAVCVLRNLCDNLSDLQSVRIDFVSRTLVRWIDDTYTVTSRTHALMFTGND